MAITTEEVRDFVNTGYNGKFLFGKNEDGEKIVIESCNNGEGFVFYEVDKDGILDEDFFDGKTHDDLYDEDEDGYLEETIERFAISLAEDEPYLKELYEDKVFKLSENIRFLESSIEKSDFESLKAKALELKKMVCHGLENRLITIRHDYFKKFVKGDPYASYPDWITDCTNATFLTEVDNLIYAIESKESYNIAETLIYLAVETDYLLGIDRNYVKQLNYMEAVNLEKAIKKQLIYIAKNAISLGLYEESWKIRFGWR